MTLNPQRIAQAVHSRVLLGHALPIADIRKMNIVHLTRVSIVAARWGCLPEIHTIQRIISY